MNYRNPQLRDLLAGEYVLGTLHGAARRRFERLLRADPELQERVTQWENRLAPLSESLPPVVPGDHVWPRIAAAVAEPARTPVPGFWQRLAVWRGMAVGAALASVILAVLLLLPVLQPPPTPGRDAVAVINDAEAQPLWLLRVDADRRVLEVEVLRRAALPAGKTHELWMLPGGEQAPVSLGLLPEARARTLRIDDPQRLLAAAGLAVSLEPAGGSPTGAPTGPVLYQAALHRL